MYVPQQCMYRNQCIVPQHKIRKGARRNEALRKSILTQKLSYEIGDPSYKREHIRRLQSLYFFRKRRDDVQRTPKWETVLITLAREV